MHVIQKELSSISSILTKTLAHGTTPNHLLNFFKEYRENIEDSIVSFFYIAISNTTNNYDSLIQDFAKGLSLEKMKEYISEYKSILESISLSLTHTEIESLVEQQISKQIAEKQEFLTTFTRYIDSKKLEICKQEALQEILRTTYLDTTIVDNPLNMTNSFSQITTSRVNKIDISTLLDKIYNTKRLEDIQTLFKELSTMPTSTANFLNGLRRRLEKDLKMDLSSIMLCDNLLDLTNIDKHPYKPLAFEQNLLDISYMEQENLSEGNTVYTKESLMNEDKEYSQLHNFMEGSQSESFHTIKAEYSYDEKDSKSYLEIVPPHTESEHAEQYMTSENYVELKEPISPKILPPHLHATDNYSFKTQTFDKSIEATNKVVHREFPLLPTLKPIKSVNSAEIGEYKTSTTPDLNQKHNQSIKLENPSKNTNMEDESLSMQPVLHEKTHLIHKIEQEGSYVEEHRTQQSQAPQTEHVNGTEETYFSILNNNFQEEQSIHSNIRESNNTNEHSDLSIREPVATTWPKIIEFATAITVFLVIPALLIILVVYIIIL